MPPMGCRTNFQPLGNFFVRDGEQKQTPCRLRQRLLLESSLRMPVSKSNLAGSRWVPAEKIPEGLAVCIVVDQNEKQLDRCLKSVSSIAAQVVVTRTCSIPGQKVSKFSEKALQQLRQLKAFVHEVKWHGSMAAVRNAAMAYVDQPWVLWLNADETLDSGCRRAIVSALKHAPYSGFYMWEKTWVLGESGEHFLRRSLRLFRPTRKAPFERSVCETVEKAVTKGGRKVGFLSNAYINCEAAIQDTDAFARKLIRRVRKLQLECAKHTTEAELFYNLGSELYSAGEFDRAAFYLALARDTAEPQNAWIAPAYAMLTVCLREIGSPESGLAMAVEAEKKGISCAELTFARAWCCMAMDAYAEAAALFEESLKASRGSREHAVVVDPSIPAYRGAMGVALALLESGQPVRAEAFARQAVAGRPERAETHILLACSYELQGRLEDAIKPLEVALELDPDNYDALNLALPVFQNTGKLTEAYHCVESMIRQSGESAGLQLQQAELLVEMKRYQEAWLLAGRIVLKNPHSPEMLVSAGRLYAECSDYKQAILVFEDAIRADRNSWNAWFNLGDVHYKTGQYTEALNAYSEGLKLNPASAEGYFAYGNTCVKCGMLEKAIECWQTAVDLKPGFAAAIHNLGIARFTLNRAA